MFINMHVSRFLNGDICLKIVFYIWMKWNKSFIPCHTRALALKQFNVIYLIFIPETGLLTVELIKDFIRIRSNPNG